MELYSPQLRRDSYAVAAKEIEDELRGVKGWLFEDSGLLREFSNSPEPFQETFGLVIPNGMDIKTYIETKLGDKQGKVLGIELGGMGSRMFSEFSEGFFARTLGMALADNRIRLLGNESVMRFTEDARRKHGVLVSNILATYEGDASNLQGIDPWLQVWLGAQGKADVIFERMLAGTGNLPVDPYLMAGVFNRWYGVLADNGMMFLQVPGFLTPLMPSWIDRLQKEYPGAFDIQFSQQDDDYGCRALRFERLPGAPDQLSFLAPREVRQLYSEYAA